MRAAMARTVALVAAAALGVTACSGGSSADPTAFARAANQLCKKLADDDAAGRASLGASPSADDFKTYIQGTYVPEAVQTYEQIAAGSLPKAHADDLKLVLADAVSEVKLIGADPATGGNKANQADLVNKMRSLGLTSCGAGFAKRIDHKTFFDQASSLCQELNQHLADSAREQGIRASSPADKKAAFVASAIPQYQDLTKQIEQIGYPPEDSDALTKLVADWRADLAKQAAQPSLFYDPTRPEAAHLNDAWGAYSVGCGVNSTVGIH